MKFKTLQENLRRILRERIAARELTGLRLSQQTGFRQAHVSNFLNRKRGLSLEGMDKVLRVLKLSVFDLIDPKDINRHANIGMGNSSEFQNVVLVAGSDACESRIGNRKVKEVLPFRKSFLNQLPSAMAGNRKRWERFLLIRVEQSLGKSMFPKLEPGAIALIDRHYTSLRSRRKGEPNLYAVRCDGQCAVRYVEQAGKELVFRPLNPAYPVAIVGASSVKNKNCVIGRVCYVGSEM
jgi:hypothetical protein